MGNIQRLSSQLSNMIAAGEVVGRPSSVVKELLENAVDAGAGKIQLFVKDSGRTLIQVIDNGCGMSEEDALLCFERHATSKIATPEDLERICTFGFRGEALASIAAIAQVDLKTRREEDEVGTHISIEGGELKDKRAESCPKGTSIEVRNIFYNTPARRKFLKSDSIEFKHIVEEFTRVSLTKTDIEFTLNHNGKDVLVLKKSQGQKFRILDLLGGGVVGEIVDISAKTRQVDISGYIGRPQSAKKTLGNQYLFVNGRFFKSAYLHKAIMNAYSEMTPDGLTPSYFIFLTVDPQSLDVNISPTKTEVKFENDSLIFQTLYACVRETLGKNGFGRMIDFDAAGAIDLPQINDDAPVFRPSEISAGIDFNSNYNPFDTPSAPSGQSRYPFGYETSRVVDKKQNYGALFEKEDPQAGIPVSHFLLGKKYICTPMPTGIMITNIGRAQVRILYEDMLEALKGNKNVCQTALFPIQVQIGAAYTGIIEENSEMLSRLGFDVTVFGNDTIVVAGVPQGYDFDEKSIQETVASLLQILSEEKHSLPEIMQANIAKKLSEAGGSKGAGLSSAAAAQSLLDRLFACKNSELTPSGKRISKLITIEELEKQL